MRSLRSGDSLARAFRFGLCAREAIGREIEVRALTLWLFLAVAAVNNGPAVAGQVGERHLTATNPTAALRDAEHRATVRVTVWYPAAAGAKEVSLDIGPPGKLLFRVGSAAPDAAFADHRRRPVILFSHGFGGSPGRIRRSDPASTSAAWVSPASPPAASPPSPPPARTWTRSTCRHSAPPI